MQSLLVLLLGSNEEQWGTDVLVEQRIRVSATRIRIADVAVLAPDAPFEKVTETAPLLRIEVLSPEDRLSWAERVTADYKTMGVQNIWLIDPIRRVAYVNGAYGLDLVATGSLSVSGTRSHLTSVTCSRNWMRRSPGVLQSDSCSAREHSSTACGLATYNRGMRCCARLTLQWLGLLIVVVSVVTPATAQDPAPHGRVILVLPFDNRSGNLSLSWIGDSFPDTLDKRLNSAGFLTISQDDRRFAYDHLGLPEDFRPSRATTIRIAQQLDANFVIVGSFTTTGDRINIQAQVLAVDELHLSSPMQDSAALNGLFDAENTVAWKVARAVDPQFHVAEATFLAAPGSVPLPAFENYTRGTNASTPAERLKRLETAVSLAPDYAAALLALGKAQYAEREYDAAAKTLAKVPQANSLALEANFYLGLARFNSANYAAAETAFSFDASRLPLPEVVNDEAVALSRQGKDGAGLFQRASSADPGDEDYHYNLAVSLFRLGDTAGALREDEAALKIKPTDNEAIQLKTRLASLPAGSRLTPSSASTGFTPVERIRRNYSEAGFRQAAFQLNQVRAARMAMLPPAQAAVEYTTLGNEYLGQGLLTEAEQQFASAVAANPRDAAAHAGLARIRESSGDAKDARTEANASLQTQPNVAALLVLARLDLADKNLQASAEDVGRALRLEPANSAVLAIRDTLQARGQSVTP